MTSILKKTLVTAFIGAFACGASGALALDAPPSEVPILPRNDAEDADAGEPPADELSADELQQRYFESLYGKVREKVSPRGIDRKALALSDQWSSAKKAPSPILRRDGAICYVYGSSTPRISCRPLRIVDVALQPGETITGTPFIGDSANWHLTPATSGVGENLTAHILIKPQMPNLVTNMIVHTDRRVYLFELESRADKKYTPYVTFVYPEWDEAQRWKDFLALLGRSPQTPRGSLVPQPLNRDYSITGKRTRWFPTEVSDDGLKTYITFPDTIEASEFPVFFILRGKKKEIVNYRPAGNAIIIDRIFDNGILVAGAGRRADTVYITRRKHYKVRSTMSRESGDSPS